MLQPMAMPDLAKDAILEYGNYHARTMDSDFMIVYMNISDFLVQSDPEDPPLFQSFCPEPPVSKNSLNNFFLYSK